MNIIIRKATIDDLEQVNVLRRQVNDLHVNGRPDIFRAGFCDEMWDRLYQVYDSKNYDVIVAVDGKTPIGYAVVEYAKKPLSPYNNERTYYKIEEIGVDKDRRDQGIGTLLMTFLKADAKESGYQKIELDVWEFNKNAMRFYESQGFSCYRRYLEVEV